MDQEASGWKTLLTRANQLVRSATHPAAQLPVEGHLPSFDGATGWLNSEPLTPAGLRGHVVLVNFWTYTCINWLRTLPYVRAWAEKAYPNLTYFNEAEAGGHFAAWEEPELFAEEMRAAFRSLH